MLVRSLLVVLVLGCLPGCPPSSPPVSLALDASASQTVDAGLVGEDAGQPTATDGGAVVEADGGVSVAKHAVLLVEVNAISDGGLSAVAFDENNTAQVEVLRGLNVNSVGLRDYRIRVIDWVDQVVSSDDTATEVDGGLVYLMNFTQPLKAGRTYTLTIEAQSGTQFTDVQGAPHDDVRYTLKVRGDVEPEPGKPAKKKKTK